MTTPNSKVSLKLIIDPKANKVLFAVAEKDFVDFLCSLLCMPLGAAINLFKGAPTFGSIETLYNSIRNLNEVHMHPNHENKDLLLKPGLPLHALGLPLFPSDAAPQRLYRCSSFGCTNKDITYFKGIRCGCGQATMSSPATVVGCRVVRGCLSFKGSSHKCALTEAKYQGSKA